jgi:D-aspartate ligase
MERLPMKKINVLIPDGNDRKALKVVQSLGLSGKIKIYILTTRNNIVKYSRFCIPFFKPKNADYDEINVIMKYILKRYPIDVILPIAEKGVKYIHRNGWLNKWNIAHLPGLNVMNQVGNKWTLSNLSKNLGIDTPNSLLISEVSAINSISKINKYPVLIKPASGAGGYGIELATNPEMLYSQLFKKYLYTRNIQFIVQEFIAGWDMDISILCSHGKILAYTIQTPISKEENVFTFSKMIRFLKNSEILEFCQKLVAHLKWNGVAHLDFIKDFSREKFFLIDFNPRFWGTLLGSTFAGVNFPYLACLSAMGVNYPIPKYKNIEFSDLNGKENLSLILKKQNKKIASMKNSMLYLYFIDPMPKIIPKIMKKCML